MTEDPPKRRSGVKAAARNLGWLLSGKGFDAVVALLYLGIATRALGLTGFGRFALIVGASEAIVTLVAFPTWQIIIQFGVKHLVAGDEAALGRLYRTALSLDILAAAVGAVLAALVIGLFWQRLGIGPFLVRYIIVYSIFRLISLRSTPLGIMRLRDNYAGAAQVDAVLPITRLLGALFVAWITPSVKAFLTVWALSELLAAIAFWWGASRTGDLKLLRAAKLDRETITRENPGLLRFAFSTNANVSITQTQAQIPLLIVGALVGTAAAGAFQLAAQLAQALGKFGQLLNRAAFPEVVHALRTAPPERIGKLLAQMLLGATAVAVVIFLIVVFAGKHVLTMVGGDDFVVAYPSMVWLGAAACIALALVGFEPVLMALHRSVSALVVRALAAVVMIAAAWELTSRMGAVGAAVGYLIGTVVAEILLAIVTARTVSRMKQRPADELAA